MKTVAKGATVSRRLFVAVEIPEAYHSQVADIHQHWAGRLRSKVGWVQPGNMHLTLRFLGDVPEVRLAAVQDALRQAFAAAVQEGFAPGGIRLSGAGFFPLPQRPRVVWLGVHDPAEQLKLLSAQVNMHLKKVGFASDSRPFVPHVTIARIRNAHKDPWPELARWLQRQSWPEFMLDGYSLYQSTLRPEGAEYARLARFRQ